MHTFREEIKAEAQEALSYFPELANVHIRFEYSRISVQSFMLAQPVVNWRFWHRGSRQYRIKIKKSLVVNNPNFSDKYPRRDVLVGWLGHELGHIVDYYPRRSLNLIWFGIRYHFFPSFLKKAEITADRNTVKAGLTRQLILSKQFGREASIFPKSYIKKLNRLYPSIEAVRRWDEEERKAKSATISARSQAPAAE